MDLALTPAALARFNDKDSKQSRFRSLYEEHSFLDAYAKHTDLRVADDPQGAIGRADEWELHGVLQLDFLKGLGLKPEHQLLDVGCGTGRAARAIVPYLDPGRYLGVDISAAALDYARELARREGWVERMPRFELNGDLGLTEQFDFIWAHSVFTHLPPQQIELMMANVAKILRGAFAFTYKVSDSPVRTGLKQYKYPPEYFAKVAKKVGLMAETHDLRWPAGQRTIVVSACGNRF